MDQTSRVILPHPQSQDVPAVPEISGLPELDSRKRRRDPKHVACDPCRRSKLSCNGLRPSCTHCLQKNRNCVYRVARTAKEETNLELESQVQRLQLQVREHAELMNRLLSSSDGEALTIIRRLQATGNPSASLSAVSGSMHDSMRPSDLTTTRAIAPPTGSINEFRLMAEYRKAYPILYPIDPVALQALVEPRMGSEAAASSTTSPASASSGLARPVQPPRFCDERLHQLQISYWTKVPISNQLAATLISFYLETEYLIMTFFDADLFLDDLIHCRQEFCSAFLVNAVLYLASQEYTAIKPIVTAVQASLFREAEILWNGEASIDSITSVAALCTFSAACLSYGKDKLGRELMKAARHMAIRLGLYGDTEDELRVEPEQDTESSVSARQTRGASYIAWGTYNWLTINVLFYHEDPIRYPPRLPIPGEGRQHGSNSAQHVHLSRHSRSTFPKICRLWKIAQEVAAVYMISHKDPVMTRVPLAFLEAKYHRLLQWMERLDEDAQRNRHSSFDLIILHMWFHVVVANLFRPFALAPDDCQLKSFQNCHPKAIYAASINQLKDIIFQYRSYYTQASVIPWLNAGLITLIIALLEEQQGVPNPARRQYLFLCVLCWEDLYVCYPVFRDVAQAFLSMAVQTDVITLGESQGIMEGLEQHGQHQHLAVEDKSSSIPDPFTDTPEERRISAMAQKFDEMVLFNDFTTGLL